HRAPGDGCLCRVAARLDHTQGDPRAVIAASSIVDLVGGTPLIRLRRIEPRPGVEIWAKAEFMNPGGSVKDRPALQMMLDGIARGRLTKEKTLTDPRAETRAWPTRSWVPRSAIASRS